MYEYAKIYYKHHGNLKVPEGFKTNNGWERDDNGKINLGEWINRQRHNVNPNSERGKLLSVIKMCFETKKKLTWEEMYEYAKIYYEHHGDLKMPFSFKTNNGWKEEKDGKIDLGRWISNQRSKVDPNSERGKLLLAIKMRFEKIRSTLSWEEMYEYAKIYYEHHDNLKVPFDFKTNNGWKEDKDGKINLGTWINSQKYRVDPNSERGKLLLAIKMCFEKRKSLTWEEMYEYAKIYYEHHGDLRVPYAFKTNNGWEQTDDGKINLGHWIDYQRQNVVPNSERGKLLLAIKMRFEIRKSLTWEEMYEYAKIYYEYHGNLNVPFGFKTNNGWERDEDGKINLGIWINTQRHKIAPNSEKGKLLLAIKMSFKKIKSTLSWKEMYEYAKIYYEHHGNLKVPAGFKTNNGWERDEDGKINLGMWISNQRKSTDPNSERGKLLVAIKMHFEKIRSTLSWEEMYEYAKIYYEYHDDLNVPQGFKTNNGWEQDKVGKINLGVWINNQKIVYKTGNLSFEQISKLESIGIIWLSKNIDDKLQAQQITDKNAMKKQKEILNRMKSLLNNIKIKEISSKDDIVNINKQFIDRLNNKKR